MSKKIIFCLGLVSFMFLSCGKKENPDSVAPNGVGNIFIADTVLEVNNVLVIYRGQHPLSGIANFQFRLYSDGITYFLHSNGNYDYGSGIGNHYWVYLYNRDTSLLEPTFYEYQKDHESQENFNGRTWNEAESLFQNINRDSVYQYDQQYRTKYLEFEILSIDSKQIEIEFAGVGIANDTVSYPFTGKYKGNYTYHVKEIY